MSLRDFLFPDSSRRSGVCDFRDSCGGDASLRDFLFPDFSRRSGDRDFRPSSGGDAPLRDFLLPDLSRSFLDPGSCDEESLL